jgi:uncharacterized protein
MNLLPRAMLWNRLDTVGTDFALIEDGSGRMLGRGLATAADPVPHVCRYELATDGDFTSRRLIVETEGAGWRREVRLERTAGDWQVTAGEHGDLAGADPPGLDRPGSLNDTLDVDLEATALTNTLPLRRLGLLGAPPGTVRTLAVAWVRVPSLRVVVVEQTYTVVAGGTVRFSSGAFSADLSIDAGGFVTDYPGYATLAGGVTQ